MLNSIEGDSTDRFTRAEPTPYFGYSRPAFRTNLRLDQENTIATDLEAGRPVLIRGFFRMGQTSMMRALENRFAPDFIQVDVRDIHQKDLEELETLFDIHALRFLAKREVTTQRQGALRYLSNHLQDQNQGVLVSVNEGGALPHNRDHARFVADMQHLPGLQLAVQMPYMDTGESVVAEFFEGFKTHKLRALRQEEVDKLTKGVTTRLESSTAFTNGALDELFELSGGRPWDVAASCEYFLREKKLKTDVNSDDVKKLLEMGITDLNQTYLRGPLIEYASIYRQLLTPVQRQVVNTVRKDGIIVAGTQAEDVAVSLVEASWFKLDPDKSGYVFNGVLLKKALTE